MLSLEHFRKEFAETKGDPKNSKYLLAISGGVDSMVLMHLFQKNGFNFHVAHINYQLRGKDSDLDQKIVEEFCKKHEIPFHLYLVSEKDNKPENSIQLWARNLRYDFFKKIKQEENINFLVTAHHLNDQLETFFINLSRGSGIKGLSGIPENKNEILRPLLQYSKEEIYEFAAQNTIEFREDHTNKKNDYLRNKIRNEIVPKLLETHPHFLDNFQKSIQIIDEANEFIKKQIEQIKEHLVLEESKEKIVFDLEKLKTESTFVHYEILIKYGFKDEKEIQKILEAKTGKTFFSQEFQLTINRNELILSPNEKETEEIQEIIIAENLSDLENKNWEITLSDYTFTDGKDFEWQFDAKKIVFPIKIRPKKNGDYFYPKGMLGKKKVSKFFKDEKLSILAKQKIRLLCDGQDNILGIIPLRQDRRWTKENDKKEILIFKA